jgi:hypothetical protein
MGPWVYLSIFVLVIGADQLSKQCAIRRLPAIGFAAGVGFGWTLSRSPVLSPGRGVVRPLPVTAARLRG